MMGKGLSAEHMKIVFLCPEFFSWQGRGLEMIFMLEGDIS
jgi:hypothetical protein